MNERQSEYRMLSRAEIEEARERWKQKRKEWLNAIRRKWGVSEMPYESRLEDPYVLVLRQRDTREVK